MSKELQRTASQVLVFLLTLVLIVASLSLAQHVLVPVALGILFSFLLGPVVRYIQRTGLKRVPAVVLVSAVAFVVFGAIFWAIGSQMLSLADNLHVYENTMHKKIAAMRQGNEQSIVSKLLGFIQRTTKELSQSADKHLDQTDGMANPSENPPKTQESKTPDPKTKDGKSPNGKPQTVIVESSTGGMVVFIVGTAREGLRLAASTGMVVVLVIVILICKEELRDRFIRLTGSHRLTLTTKALDEAAKRISDYLFRKAIVNSVYGVVIAIGLFFLDVPFCVVWGFLIAVLRFIPSLGFWLGLIPPALLSLVTTEGWETFFLVFGLFLVAEVVALNIVEPRFYGRQIGLLPVATLISVSFWTWLWGPVGLLLGIPITLCLAVLGKYVPSLDFLNVLLSDQPAMDPTLRYYQRLIANDQDEATQIVETYLAGAAAENVYDDLLLPALSHAKRDVANGQLTTLDQDFFFRTTREILDNVCEPAIPKPVLETNLLPAVKIAGCPVGDENDLLALSMVNQQLQARGYRLELGAAGRLSSEVVDWVESESPGVVCLLSVAPGELTQTRFVCKRIRSRLPNVTIVAARLGAADELKGDTDVLLKAGANHVCGTVAETARQLNQELQHAALQIPKPELAATGA